MNKRKYNKKSPYWEKFSKASKEPPKIDSIPPIFAGDSYYTESQASFVIEAMANRNEPIATRTNRRSHGKHKESKKDKYSNIREGLLPYDVSGAGISIRESVELCQKAYANISIFRNAIDVMSEFANSEIQL